MYFAGELGAFGVIIPMFVRESHTCAFVMTYTSIETSPNACTGWPYLLKLLCRDIALQVAMLQIYVQ